MTYTPSQDSANAERRNYMEIPLSTVAAITGAEEATEPTSMADADSRRYAQLIHIVGGSISTSPSPATTTTTDHKSFTEYIETDTINSITWVAQAVPGSSLASAVWRVKKIATTTGSLEITRITWADGNSNFDNAATSPLSGLTFA